MGTTSSGIHAHPRGWNIGVEVDGYTNGEHDSFAVRVSAASNGGRRSMFLAQVTETDDGGFELALGEELAAAVGSPTLQFDSNGATAAEARRAPWNPAEEIAPVES